LVRIAAAREAVLAREAVMSAVVVKGVAMAVNPPPDLEVSASARSAGIKSHMVPDSAALIKPAPRAGQK